MSDNGSSDENYDGREAQGAQILELEAGNGAVSSRSICTKIADDIFHMDILRFLYTCLISIKIF